MGQVIGSDGKNYAYASLPAGVKAVAKICYVSGSNGLAFALTDEGQMNWNTAKTTCAAHKPAFTGGTWKLPTRAEWNNMITAAGGRENLSNGFSSVGGTNMVFWGGYLSADTDEDGFPYYFVNAYEVYWSNCVQDDVGYYARACLAF